MFLSSLFLFFFVVAFLCCGCVCVRANEWQSQGRWKRGAFAWPRKGVWKEQKHHNPPKNVCHKLKREKYVHPQKEKSGGAEQLRADVSEREKRPTHTPDQKVSLVLWLSFSQDFFSFFRWPFLFFLVAHWSDDGTNQNWACTEKREGKMGLGSPRREKEH